MRELRATVTRSFLLLCAALLAAPGLAAAAAAEQAIDRAVELLGFRPAVNAPPVATQPAAKAACASGSISDEFAAVLFDAALPGDGFYLVGDDANLSVAYFGYDADGELLWLVGTVPAVDVAGGLEVSIPLVQVGPRGRFSVPQNPLDDAVPSWGTVEFSLACAGSGLAGTATLDGSDGSKTLALSSLVAGGVAKGGDGSLVPARLGAVAFDATAPGDGFYLVSDDANVSLAFFGYRADGAPLWMVSTVPVADADLSPGGTTNFAMSIGGPQGRFATPQNPLAAPLPVWGDVELTADCTASGSLVGEAVLQGLDGDKPMRLTAILDLGACPDDLDPADIAIAAETSETPAYERVDLDVDTALGFEQLMVEVDVGGRGRFQADTTLVGPLPVAGGTPRFVAPPLSFFQRGASYRYDVRVLGPAGSVSNVLTFTQAAKGFGLLPPAAAPVTMDMVMKIMTGEAGDSVLAGASGQVQPGATSELLDGLDQDSDDYDENAAALLDGIFGVNTEDYPPGSRKGLGGVERAIIEIFDCLAPAFEDLGATPTEAADACFDVAVRAVRDGIIPSIDELHGRIASTTTRLSSLLGSRAGRGAGSYAQRIAFSAQTTSYANSLAQLALRLPPVENDPDALLDYVGGRLTRYGRGRLYDAVTRDLTAFDREIVALLSDPGVVDAVSGLSADQIAALRGLENELLNTRALGDQLENSPESYGGTGSANVGVPGSPLPGDFGGFEGSPTEYCRANPDVQEAAIDLGFESCEAFVTPFFDQAFLESVLLPLFEELNRLFTELEASGCFLPENIASGGCQAFFVRSEELLNRLIAALMGYADGGCDPGYAAFETRSALNCVWEGLVASTNSRTCPGGSRVPPFDLGTRACITFSRDYIRDGQCLENYTRVFFAPLGAETCRWSTLPLSLPAAYAVDEATRSRRTLER